MNTSLTLSVVSGEPRIDSRIVAAELGIEHKNVRDLITRYSDEFQSFGIYPFETDKFNGRGRPEQFALLNEDQTYFLMTLVRNSEKAVELKRRLVQAFSECRKRLASPLTTMTTDQLHTGNMLLVQAVKAFADEFSERIERIEKQLPMEETHCTIRAYATRHNLGLDAAAANKMGRMAANMTQARGLPLVRVPDARYGQVNAYLISILDECAAAQCKHNNTHNLDLPLIDPDI